MRNPNEKRSLFRILRAAELREANAAADELIRKMQRRLARKLRPTRPPKPKESQA